MGGFGSGNRTSRANKTAVEDCLTLAVRDIPKPPYAPGYFIWRSHAGDIITGAAYRVSWDEGGPMARLTYWLRDGQVVQTGFRYQTTRPGLGGLRWWFECPLTVNGVPCGRRVGRLYLPPWARYFGCRHCFRLTYRSCQQAHETERLLAWLCKSRAFARGTSARPARNRGD